MEYLTPIQYDLLNELSKGISLTRNDLVETLNKSRTTLYDNLEKLEKKKLIKRYRKQNGLVGRPLTFWFIPKNLLHELFKEIGENNEKS